jgi:hypothetical protein
MKLFIGLISLLLFFSNVALAQGNILQGTVVSIGDGDKIMSVYNLLYGLLDTH